MKAKDIIAQLEALPPDAEVMACCCSWCEGEETKKVVVVRNDYQSEKRHRVIYSIQGGYE